MTGIDQPTLDNLNVAQGRKENKAYLTTIGGIDGLIKMIGVDITTGLTAEQVCANKAKLGDNTLPQSPTKSFLSIFFLALSDRMLIVLIVAACVSFAIGKR